MHTTVGNLRYLKSKFATVISKVPEYCREEMERSTTLFINWPSHSPDLSSCDHWLWARMNKVIYSQGPQAESVAELIDRIRDSINHIPADEVFRSVRATARWSQQCRDADGGHF